MEWNKIEKLINLQDFEHIDKDTVNAFSSYKIGKRTQKTFYYAPGKNPLKDTLSQPLLRESVEIIRKAVPSSVGKLGPYHGARVVRDACVSPCSMLLALIYIERLSKYNSAYLASASSSEIFLVSMLIASKFMYDEGTDEEVYNDEWSASSHMDVKNLKKLEAGFLSAIDWKVFVSKDEFHQMLLLIEAKLALRNGLERGWFSYTDLTCLLMSSRISQNFRDIAISFIQTFGVLMVGFCGLAVACIGASLTTLLSTNTSTEVAFSHQHKLVFSLPILENKSFTEKDYVAPVTIEVQSEPSINVEADVETNYFEACNQCRNHFYSYYFHYNQSNNILDNFICHYPPIPNEEKQIEEKIRSYKIMYDVIQKSHDSYLQLNQLF